MLDKKAGSHSHPLKDLAKWAEDFRRFWDESFNRLDAYLQVMKSKEMKPRK
ncbi:MAG: hypothetical protein ABIW76_22310 [Fibrobacteria bacterium]